MNNLLVIPPSPNHRRIIRNIDCSHEAKADYLWQPNDFLVISSLMQPEDQIHFVDGTADRLDDSSFYRQFEGEKADLLFFLLSSACWETDVAYYRRTREKFPQTPCFVLGDIFLEKSYQEIILQECEGIVIQPYWLDLKAMLDLRAKPSTGAVPGVITAPGQQVLGNPTKPTSFSGGYPRHEIFLNDNYIFPFSVHKRHATVTLSWGCPFTCSYCTDAHFPPSVRQPEDVLAELAHIDSLGVKELFFADKTFGFPKKVSLPLLLDMAKRFNFSWSCYFHPQHYDEELFQAMCDAGCHTIIIGIDSVDLGSLKEYQRTVSEKKLTNLLGHANRQGISICADFILGLRHESVEDVRKTINYALSLSIDFASFNIAAPLPGSVIRQEAIEEGTFKVGVEGYDTKGEMGIIGHGKAEAEQIRKLRNRAILRFYIRPSYWLRRLKRTKSLEHLGIQLRQMVGLFN
ncbi:MAG: radical SAM protein [bacterium]|nr:radical SAM protein [bacterium]